MEKRTELRKILDIKDPSGRMSRGQYVKDHYLELYNDIIAYCTENNLLELPFRQQVYHYRHDIKDIVLCKNPNCNNVVNLKNSTLGYHEYCCNYCIGSDPNMLKRKEET